MTSGEEPVRLPSREASSTLEIQMRAETEDLLAGALALAYKYTDLRGLRQAFGADGADLPARLVAAAGVSDGRADKLRRGAALARRLLTDAIYGTVALRNQLVGPQMLNACMEETRRSGHARSLSDVLIEREVLSKDLHDAIVARLDEVLPDLLAKERAVAGAIDLDGEADEVSELKLSMLLGEVAAKLAFLSRGEFDAALRAAAGEAAPPAAPAASPPAASPPAAGASSPAPGGLGIAPNAIKGYELTRRLGEGAMGAVYQARKLDSGEVVAMKILKPELTADREDVERFLREAKAVARLSHKNIMRAVQVGKSGEFYFFAMEFIEGQTVHDLIHANKRLPERFSVQVTACVAAALGHAWQHRIVHRDIKPDNMMISKDGAVKLTDLGLARTAKVTDSTLTMSGAVMGSPAYMSPEQAAGDRELDVRSDLYALGASLVHMLTGSVPYPGDTPLAVMLKHMNDPVPDVRKASPGVSEATRRLVMSLMAKRPEQRLQAAQHVEAAARAIEEALGRGEVPAIPPELGGGVTPAAAPGAAGPAAPGAAASAPPRGGAASARPGAKPSPEQAKRKEVGDRLRRMKGKRKRRF